MWDEPAGTEGEMIRTSTGALLVLGLAGAVGVVGAEAQEPRLIEIDDMFEVRSVGAPVVSPDGEWIAYTVGRTSLEDERSYTRVYS
jgi:hypothetical protein